MILQFKYNSEVIDIIINKKRIKNIYIKLNKNNDIEVSAPIISSKKFIESFINEHLEKFIKIKKNNVIKQSINLETQSFYLFGNVLYYELIDKIDIKTNQIQKYLVFNSKKYKINKKTPLEIIQTIYKKELFIYLKTKQFEFEKMMNIHHHEIGIRNKQTSWASNNITNHKINYNIKLAAYSFEIINYVIVHELAHAIYANHSPKFWVFVSKYEPDFKMKKKKLNSFHYF